MLFAPAVAPPGPARTLEFQGAYVVSDTARRSPVCVALKFRTSSSPPTSSGSVLGSSGPVVAATVGAASTVVVTCTVVTVPPEEHPASARSNGGKASPRLTRPLSQQPAPASTRSAALRERRSPARTRRG